MVLIGDMKQNAEVLAECCRFKTVAEGLQKLLEGTTLSDGEHKQFGYLVDLFGQIDWDSPHYKSHEHIELTVMAATLRPILYKKLIELHIPFNSAYSERVYQMLKSRSIKEFRKEAPRVKELFQSISDYLFSDLQPSPDYDPD